MRVSRIVLFFLALVLGAQGIVRAGEEVFRFAVLSDCRRSVNGLSNALAFIDSRNVDVIFVAGDFDPVETGYTGYFKAHGYTVDPARSPDRQKVYFALGNHDHPPAGEIFFQKALAPRYPANGPGRNGSGLRWSSCHAWRATWKGTLASWAIR